MCCLTLPSTKCVCMAKTDDTRQIRGQKKSHTRTQTAESRYYRIELLIAVDRSTVHVLFAHQNGKTRFNETHKLTWMRRRLVFAVHRSPWLSFSPLSFGSVGRSSLGNDKLHKTATTINCLRVSTCDNRLSSSSLPVTNSSTNTHNRHFNTLFGTFFFNSCGGNPLNRFFGFFFWFLQITLSLATRRCVFGFSVFFNFFLSSKIHDLFDIFFTGNSVFSFRLFFSGRSFRSVGDELWNMRVVRVDDDDDVYERNSFKSVKSRAMWRSDQTNEWIWQSKNEWTNHGEVYDKKETKKETHARIQNIVQHTMSDCDRITIMHTPKCVRVCECVCICVCVAVPWWPVV